MVYKGHPVSKRERERREERRDKNQRDKKEKKKKNKLDNMMLFFRIMNEKKNELAKRGQKEQKTQ